MQIIFMKSGYEYTFLFGCFWAPKINLEQRVNYQIYCNAERSLKLDQGTSILKFRLHSEMLHQMQSFWLFAVAPGVVVACSEGIIMQDP